MQEPRNLDKKIIVTISLIICVFAFSLINTATSKKPDNSVKGVSNDGVINGGNGIEVYWNSKCTNRVSSIDWGHWSREPSQQLLYSLRIEDKIKLL